MSLSLAAILAESALRYPYRDAVVMGPQRISYTSLWEESRRYAAVLRERGIGPGDRVALLVPNVPDFPRAYYAVLSLGAVLRFLSGSPTRSTHAALRASAWSAKSVVGVW